MLRLHQLAASHYNDKVRWALSWKGIPHERVTYLPGPHAFRIRRMTGQTATPVLEVDGRFVTGSATIIELLERRFPERPLYPADPAQRLRTLTIQREFDAEVGPATRTAIFSVLLSELGYLARLFGRTKPAPVRALYRAALPLARGRIGRANGTIDPANVRAAFERSRRALDFVATHVGARGQLVGDGFSVADLCCAALLAPLVNPPHPDMAFPEPIPARVAACLAEFADHPGARWVREQYVRHRPAAVP